MSAAPIPPGVDAALRELMLTDRRGAVLRVNAEGGLIEAAGEAALYGLSELKPGANVADAAPVLMSVLPASEQPQVVRLLELAPGVFADVGSVRVNGEDWVVFTDFSEEANLRRQLQQRAVDLSLLREREQKAMADLAGEQAFSTRLLESIFPKPVIDKLRAGQSPIADEYADATVLFAGLHNFAFLTRSLKAVEVVDLLARLFAAFDALAAEHGVAKIKSVGEVYLCVGGVPTLREDHAAAVAELALAMQRAVGSFTTPGGEPLSLRIGIDRGPVVAGVVGTSRLAYDVWGRPVDAAQQMQLFGIPGAIQLTSAAAQGLRGRYSVEPRGEFFAQGSGVITTHLLRGAL